MLKPSHKNLRWEEAHFLYCKCNNLDLTFEEFFDEAAKPTSNINLDEFDTLSAEVRIYCRQWKHDEKHL